MEQSSVEDQPFSHPKDLSRCGEQRPTSAYSMPLLIWLKSVLKGGSGFQGSCILIIQFSASDMIAILIN
jgi:hypothetical protein